MKKPKGFFTYFHLRPVIKKLTDEQAGRLYKALLDYGGAGEETDFSDDVSVDMAYTLMCGEIDVNFERYQEVCEIRSHAAQKRWDEKHGESMYLETACDEKKHGIY